MRNYIRKILQRVKKERFKNGKIIWECLTFKKCHLKFVKDYVIT